MELSLLHLAISHLLAAKVGSWAMGGGRLRRDFEPYSCSHDSAIKLQKPQVSKSMGWSRKRRQKKSDGNTSVHRKDAAQQGFERDSNLRSMSSSSISARAATAQKQRRACVGVVPTAWMLAGHSSAATTRTRSPWARPRHSEESKPRQQPAQPLELEDSSDSNFLGMGQLAPNEDVTGSLNPAGSLVRWWIPRHLQHPQNGEQLVEGWHLDDEPMPAQYDTTPPNAPSTSIAAAFSAAASRLFGGGSGRGEDFPQFTRRPPHKADSQPGIDGSNAVLQPLPTTRGSTPHLVGCNAIGAINDKNVAGAGNISSVNSGDGMGIGIGGSSSSSSSSSSKTASAAAAALTSASGALGDLAERAVEVPVRGLRELNRAVTASVSDFLASDSGRRLSEQMVAEMSTGALMAPVYLTEELVKARLKSLLRSHARWLATYLAVRVSLTTAALHCAKELVRRSVRKRGPSWLRGAVHFICDVMLPTGFFGPFLGVTIGVLQLAGGGLGGLIRLRGGGGGGSSAGPPIQPPMATALPAVAAAASGAVAATLSATAAPVAAAANALAGSGGGGG
ncbi:hypothetical protein Vretimale_17348 [Volvox reticuliferus]|uniref:Uncharacterized protein n=1 Tax=Volvox reticuliferus TaxID=1737510 RepID=A0A8J4LYB9_9CHLO|nr:hypothetical protein Vretifemale_15 [Volvox reticuliferus]GIM14428.1 hypothetical protein Vretimale_17348 [Volvox reticuliferus]